MRIKYYFDFLSPYSYISWNWVREMHMSGQVEFDFIPVVLGKIIGSYDTKGPAEIEPKRNYLYKDCLRKASLRGIPFTLPKRLPFNSLDCLRFALKGVSGDSQFKIIDSIFYAGWRDGRDIGEFDVLMDVLREQDFAVDELSVVANSKDARKELKENIKSALGEGVFGVPTFKVEDELFWGDDSREHIERYLDGKDNYDKNRYLIFEKGFPFI